MWEFDSTNARWEAQRACVVTAYLTTLFGVAALRPICVAAEAPGDAESPGRLQREVMRMLGQLGSGMPHQLHRRRDGR